MPLFRVGSAFNDLPPEPSFDESPEEWHQWWRTVCELVVGRVLKQKKAKHAKRLLIPLMDGVLKLTVEEIAMRIGEDKAYVERALRTENITIDRRTYGKGRPPKTLR